MGLANNRAVRLVAVGGFAAALAAAPAYAALATPEVGLTDQVVAKCLAWLGSREDGVCIGVSNGSPVSGGIPPVAIGGPTGPVFPGQTINIPLG